MDKYQRLADRLSRHPRDHWRASFAELEEVLGFPLPKSAREREGWWSNETMTERTHKLAWLKQGWRAEDVDQVSGMVTFRRNGASSAPARPSEIPPPAMDRVAASPSATVGPPKDMSVSQALGLAVLAAGGAALGALMAQGLRRRA